MNSRYIRQHNNELLLQYASEGKDSSVTELLDANLAIKAVEVNCVRETDFSTPLHLAVESGDLYTVNLLIQNGSHLDQRRLDGKTPLFLAAENNHVDIAELLLVNGAHVNKPVGTHQYVTSPLIEAKSKNNTDMVNLLLKFNASDSSENTHATLKEVSV